jgi:PsbP-like protein
MRKISITLLVVTTLLNSVWAQKVDEAPWVTLAPEGAGFSVSLPAAAMERVDTKTAYTMHAFTVVVGRATYVASYTDYEPGKLNAKTALTANRDKFNKNLQATMTSSREITIDGHTGLEFTSETPAHNVKSQLFLIGNRMFQTATVVYKDVDETRNVNRFFDSFKFTPK